VQILKNWERNKSWAAVRSAVLDCILDDWKMALLFTVGEKIRDVMTDQGGSSTTFRSIILGA
jgi:hypothetical protein